MARADVPRPGRSFLERFGGTILRGGIAPVPATLYFYQAELGLSPQEVWFIGYILAHKWDAELPHPSLVKMAERVDVSVRQLHRIKDGLVAKRLLELVPRHNVVGGKDANGYDFTALFSRLEDLIERHGARGERPVAVPGVAHEGDGTRASHRDVPSASQTDLPPESYTHVTPESYTYVTSLSHDSEADHIEADHVETDHEEPPPTITRHIPLGIPRASSEVARRVVEAGIRSLDSDVCLLVERLGMDEETAQECVRLSRERGRSKGYVTELVDHALSDPLVRDPLKVVISNIRRNERRTPTHGPRVHRQQPVPTHRMAPAPKTEPAERVGESPPAADSLPLDPEEPTAPVWKTALTTLRFGLPVDDYHAVVQYVQLREIDREQGWALLSVPNHHLCDQVQTRLREPIQAALRLAAGTPLRLVVVVAAVHGTPTLAQILAADTPLLTSPSTPSQAAANGPNVLEPEETASAPTCGSHPS